MLNSAPNGGAMAIGGTSKVILRENVQLHFIKNKATHDGGALVFESYDVCPAPDYHHDWVFLFFFFFNS